MKKLLSYIVLLSFISSSNFTFVFASNTTSVWEKEIQNTEKLLDSLESNLSNILETAWEKIKNQDILDKIETKKEEIKELVEQAKEELQEANSKTELNQKVQVVQNTLVLKAVSSLTPTIDTTDELEKQIVIKTIEEKEKAKETLLDSLKTWDDYRVMIKSSQNQEKTLELLKKFDTNIQIEFLYEQDGKQIFELIITQNSLLQKELFENIDTWEIPNNLLWIEIIQPELLQIWEIDFSWEDSDKLWGLKKYHISNYQNDIKLQTLKNGTKLKVWIIDTGIDIHHPDLKENIHPNLWYNFIQENTHFFDDQWHGTHVAGTVAWAINWAWVFWVNPNVELVPLKICDSAWFCPTYWVIKSLQYATENKLDILNMSLWAKWNRDTSPICSAIKEATSAGIIVVVASGNSNIDTSRFVPGGCSEAITVWAVDENLNRAMFSNFWEKVDISAPWVGIYSSYPNNGYKSLNGTSMATPHIVGIVSILKTYNPNLQTKEIKQILKNNSFPVKTESWKTMPWFVDMEKLMSSFVKNDITTEEKETQEQKIEEIKQEEKEKLQIEEIQTKENESEKTQNTQNTENNTQEENIAIIDESIWLIIQEEETTQINSVEERELSSENFENVQEDLTQINSENASEEVWVIDKNLVFTNEEDIEEETTQINSAEEDKEMISDEETTQINSENADEVFEKVNNVEVWESEELEDTSEESEEQTGIQWTYYCTIMVWWNCVYNFSWANSYSYSVSVWWIISLWTSSSQFRVTGSRAWSTVLYIKQNGREIHRVYVTVNNPRNLVISTSSVSIQNGNTATFTIRDGNGWYTTTSNNTSIATVSLNWATATITAKAVWSTTITVRDSTGRQINLPVTITAKDLRVDTTSLSLLQWNNGYINITSGNGWYSITRDNNNVTLYANGTTGYRVYANTPWTTRLQIRDSAGRSVNITVTITAPRNLVISTSSVSIQNGNTATFTIRDGNGWYTTTSNNTSIATVSFNGTTATITARAVWSTTITVRDSTGRQINLPVTITAKPLTLDKTSITIDEKTSGYINITNGNGWYSITKNNTNVSVYANGTTGYRVYGERVWSSVLNIKDSAGKVVSVSVTVRELPKIISYSHTPTVEEWYIWWFYFKIDKPNLVKEAWIEYFHTNSINIIPRATDWKKQTLKVETDWEFGAFILPRSKINYVRWYIVTQSGNKIYTSTNWNIIASNVSLYDYYNLWWWQVIANVWDDEVFEDEENENIWENSESEYSENESEEWVEVNAAFLIPVAIFVWSFAIWVVSDYYCELNGGKFYLPSTWTQNNTFNFSCAISAWTTVVWVTALVKWAAKVAVTKYSSKSVVENTAKSLGKSGDDIARLGNTIWWLNFSPIAYSHMLEKARYVPIEILKTVIKTSKWIKDPRWTSSLMYYSKVYINWKEYNLEVLYEASKNIIWHFKYTRDSIWNLPKIP